MVKKRNIVIVILLSIATFGIYPIVMYSVIGNEVNMICDGDGKKQMPYILALLLGLVTFGIYPMYWTYRAMERLRDNAYRYGTNVNVPHTGESYLLWTLLGVFIVVGPLIGAYNFIEDVNAFADLYGFVQPMNYTMDYNERRRGPQPIPQQNGGWDGAYALPDGNNNGQSGNYASNSMGQQQGNANRGYSDAPPTVSKEKSRTGVISGVSGMYAGVQLHIKDGEVLFFGRDPAVCQVVLNMGAETVSARHCTVSYNADKGNYTVKDFSSNGTFLASGDKLPQNFAITLDRNTIIYLGDRNNGFRLGL